MVNIYFNHLTILVVILQFLLVSSSNTSNLISFSTYLIHRDSLYSPLYNSFINTTNLLDRAIYRSSSRLSHLKSISKLPNNDAKEINDIETTIEVSRIYEYLIEISIGTPPIKQMATFDTGSHFVWTQCLPCVNCYIQTQPKFNSDRSSSYNILRCGDQNCKYLGDTRTCKRDHLKCEYILKYKDNSTSSGDLALETYKLGNTSFRNMVYGCSRNNNGIYEEISAGIVGFGNGPLSLISQLGNRVGGKFAYCLVHHSELYARRSKISFGASAIVYGHNTPLKSGYVTLKGISVEDITFPIMVDHEKNYKRIPFRIPALLDTGTFLSYLPTFIYQQLEDALKSVIREVPVQHPYDASIFKLCYSKNPHYLFPDIIYHFSGGAELVLTAKNTIIPNGGLWCLVIGPNDNLVIIGSLSQMDHMIGYDYENDRVSFMATDCSI